MVSPRGRFIRLLIQTFVILAALIVPAVSRAADDQNQPPHRELTPEQLLRKRIAESLAGRRDRSAPKSQTLRGPDLTEREKVEHVLNRLSYGFAPGDVEEVIKNGGYQAWIKRQLEPDKIDDSECDKLIAQRFPFTAMTMSQLRDTYNGPGNREKMYQLHSQFPESVLTRAVMSKRQFKEVMCDFWRNHFCVDQPREEEKSRSWTDVDYEQTVIRRYVFGKFGDMLFASARHPAMLEYLDNKLSKANAWNENYAREVMELHTLGADRGYGNGDVLELSKALTGWRYDDNFNFIFDPSWHQPGVKHWLGMTLPPGYKGGVQALTVLATHPNTAEFISQKLCQYLVNDNPPPPLVRKVAGVFRESQGDLPKVYAAILNSPEFLSQDNYRSKFKTPFQFSVSALRATAAQVEDAAEVVQTLRKMGEPIYDCPDPTGYRDQAESWMDSGVLTSRWQFAWNLARGAVSGVKIPEPFFNYYRRMKPAEAEAKMIEDLIGSDIGDRELAAMREAAVSQDVPRMTSILLGSPSFQQR